MDCIGECLQWEFENEMAGEWKPLRFITKIWIISYNEMPTAHHSFEFIFWLTKTKQHTKEPVIHQKGRQRAQFLGRDPKFYENFF